MPVFSVIMPCYNSAGLMRRGLDSLCRQSFRDFEVIFVDDCSTDRTHDLLVNFLTSSGLCGQVLRNSKNSGPGVSRNHGISKAAGVYVVFMDSDDWYEDDFLEQICKVCGKSNPDLIFFNFYRCFGNGEKQAVDCTDRFVESTTKREFLALAFDALWTMAAKKKLFDGLKIPRLYNAEDAATVPLLISLASSISFIG